MIANLEFCMQPERHLNHRWLWICQFTDAAMAWMLGCLTLLVCSLIGESAHSRLSPVLSLFVALHMSPQAPRQRDDIGIDGECGVACLAMLVS